MISLEMLESCPKACCFLSAAILAEPRAAACHSPGTPCAHQWCTIGHAFGAATATVTPAPRPLPLATFLPMLRPCLRCGPAPSSTLTQEPFLPRAPHTPLYLRFKPQHHNPSLSMHACTLTESPNSPSTRLARSRPHRKTWVRHSKPPWLAASSGRAHFLSRPWQRSWVWRSKPPTSEAGLGFSTPKRPSLPYPEPPIPLN